MAYGRGSLKLWTRPYTGPVRTRPLAVTCLIVAPATLSCAVMSCAVMSCAVSPAKAPEAATPSAVQDEEVVVLFPTWAAPGAEGGQDQLPVHGWVYEPESDSLARRAAIGAFRRLLGLPSEAEQSAVFKRRAALFLVDNERGKRVAVRIGERDAVLPQSTANGHFEGPVDLSKAELAALPRPEADTGADIVRIDTAPSADGRVSQGRIHLIGASGLSVISDIDDTLKITEVTHLDKLIDNTFMKEFRAVPGMSDLYRAWARQGAAFHFVSSSPWQLYPELADFAESGGFPSATFHLKLFRAKDATVLNLFKSGEETKPPQIQPILDAFPGRTFILVGDSGEKDPEVYGALYRNRPQQIRHIYIRNVTDETLADDRFQQAFDGVPKARRTLFEDPATLAP